MRFYNARDKNMFPKWAKYFNYKSIIEKLTNENNGSMNKIIEKLVFFYWEFLKFVKKTPPKIV